MCPRRVRPAHRDRRRQDFPSPAHVGSGRGSPDRSWKETRCHGHVELDRCRHADRDPDCPVHGHSHAFHRGQPVPAQPPAAAGRRRCAQAGRRRQAEGPGAETGADDAAPAGYLYVPCARIRSHGSPAQTRRWVQQVPIVKKTAQLIYYASDSWDRREAVISPGRISREQFETDTRCGDDREHCPHGDDRCRHGYPAGVIPVPGDRHRPDRPAGCSSPPARPPKTDLDRGEREPAGQAAPRAPLIRELRRAMADAHPDRGGTTGEFIQARRRYQTALRPARG